MVTTRILERNPWRSTARLMRVAFASPPDSDRPQSDETTTIVRVWKEDGNRWTGIATSTKRRALGGWEKAMPEYTFFDPPSTADLNRITSSTPRWKGDKFKETAHLLAEALAEAEEATTSKLSFKVEETRTINMYYARLDLLAQKQGATQRSSKKKKTATSSPIPP